MDNSTFAVERDLLQRQERAIRMQADQLMEKVPKELRSRKSWYTLYLVLSIFGAAGGLGAGIFTLVNRQ